MSNFHSLIMLYFPKGGSTVLFSWIRPSSKWMESMLRGKQYQTLLSMRRDKTELERADWCWLEDKLLSCCCCLPTPPTAAFTPKLTLSLSVCHPGLISNSNQPTQLRRSRDSPLDKEHNSSSVLYFTVQLLHNWLLPLSPLTLAPPDTSLG